MEECIFLFPNSDARMNQEAGVNNTPRCLDGASEYQRTHPEHLKFCPYNGEYSRCPRIPEV